MVDDGADTPESGPFVKTAPPADDCEQMYANGFEIGFSLSDVNVLFSIIGHRHCRLHMSFTTAKTLAIALSEALKNFEKTTEQTIMTMGEVDGRVSKAFPTDDQS